jgi:hypothetical protein
MGRPAPVGTAVRPPYRRTMEDMPHRHTRHDDDAVRITTAPRSAAEEQASRQRRYLVSMAIRTACVVGAVAVGDGVLRWILIVGAVFLPYVAVVMANVAIRPQRDADLDPVSHRYAELPPVDPATKSASKSTGAP